MLLSIVGFLIVLGLAVSLHELGHFLAARWAKIRVDVFSIGFGRPLIKWHDKLGTEWRIAWLPLGGFVSIYGQGDMFARQKYGDLSAKEKIGHYLSAPAWKQAVVIGAGVFMNLLSAFVIYTGLFAGTRTIQLPVIGETTSRQIKSGDRILQINGKKISSWEEMLMEKEMGAGRDAAVIILRDTNLVMLKMPPGKWGIAPDESKTETVKNGPLAAIGTGGSEVWRQSKLLFAVIGQMVSGERSSKQMGGILTIAEMSGRALSAGIAAFMTLIALLSVNLAVINLFPLPVLDGGYLLILGIEAITRRKLQGRAMDLAIKTGWWLLIALMAFTFWNDISRIFIAKA